MSDDIAPTDLEMEFYRLRTEFDALTAEHAALESRPVDIPEHERHRARLRTLMAELRAHMARIAASRGRPPLESS